MKRKFKILFAVSLTLALSLSYDLALNLQAGEKTCLPQAKATYKPLLTDGEDAALVSGVAGSSFDPGIAAVEQNVDSQLSEWQHGYGKNPSGQNLIELSETFGDQFNEQTTVDKYVPTPCPDRYMEPVKEVYDKNMKEIEAENKEIEQELGLNNPDPGATK